MIFKGVREGKPYAEHGLTAREWAQIPPRQIRLDELTTLTTVLALDKLLSEDSTFYGDLFAHVVLFEGNLYLEDGLHRAVRACRTAMAGGCVEPVSDACPVHRPVFRRRGRCGSVRAAVPVYRCRASRFAQ